MRGKSAIDTGVARRPVTDWDAYKKSLDKRLSVHIKTHRGIKRILEDGFHPLSFGHSCRHFLFIQ